FTLNNLVNGEWFVNLDGDDYFTNLNFISAAVNYISSESSSIVAFHGNININEFSKFDIEYQKIDSDTLKIEGLAYIKIVNEKLNFSHAAILFNTKKALVSNFYNVDNLASDYFSYLK